jgi:rubrerythrin
MDARCARVVPSHGGSKRRQTHLFSSTTQAAFTACGLRPSGAKGWKGVTVCEGGVAMVVVGHTALEALGIAVRREMDAATTYGSLAAGCANPLARDRFRLLEHEAQQHESLLRRRYQELFPDVPLVAPPAAEESAPAPSGGHHECEGLKGALRYAIETERRAREFYLDASAATSDLTGQAMFRYLADQHARHQMVLDAEYDTVLRYPHAFDDPQAPWRPERRLRQE